MERNNCLFLKQVESQGAVFFTQWETWGSDGVKGNKPANGKLLLGKVIQQMPEKIAVQLHLQHVSI